MYYGCNNLLSCLNCCENITLQDLSHSQSFIESCCSVERKKPFELRIQTISSSCTCICLWTSAIWNRTSPAQRERGRQGENTWKKKHSTAQASVEQKSREEQGRKLEKEREETGKARERERLRDPQRAKLMQWHKTYKHTGQVTCNWDNERTWSEFVLWYKKKRKEKNNKWCTKN